MVILKTIALTCFFLVGISACRSAPPNDLSDPLNAGPRGSRVNEDDLVYTDNTKPLPDPEKDFASIKTDIVGRSSPGREGKAIVKLRRGERVNVLKPSQDGRWLAVVNLKTRRKSWVPATAVKQATVTPTGAAPAPGGYDSGSPANSSQTPPGIPPGY